jgi:hypothetical protein
MAGRGLVILALVALVFSAMLTAVPSSSSSEAAPEPAAPDPLIQTLVDAVSLDRLYTYNYDLQNFTTRYFGTQGLNDSAEYILTQFGQKPALVNGSQYFTYGGQVIRNVYAVLPGFDPANETVYIMGGHYDSWNQDTDPATLAPGADDNGSGTSATMEASRVLSDYRFNATIIFIAWTAEERGLIGSQYHAASLAADNAQVGAVLNHDMVAYDPLNTMEYDLMSNPESAWILAEMDAANTDYGIGLNLSLFPNSGAQASDHASFWAEGFPAIFASEGNFNSANWHRSSDTVDKLNFELETRGTKLAVATLAKFAGILTPGNGYVALDKEIYGLYDVAGVRVYDTDLNADPLTAESVSVTVSSDSEPAGEQVLLTETESNSSIFEGSVQLGIGPPASGLLEVQHGDVVTATYEEANPLGTRTDTARVDGFPPQIWNVAATPDVTSATVTWETDVPATSAVDYGATAGLGDTASDPAFAESHSLLLLGLTPETTYYFRVRSADEAGNEAVDDNGGALYRFRTLSGMTSTPNYGYVGWVRHTEPTGNHFTSTEILVGHSDLRNAPEGTNYKGAAQFSVSAIPGGATITNASVQFYGERWIYTDIVKDWRLRHLNGSIDAGWTTHNYSTINNSAVDATIPPTLTNPDLTPGAWNYFYYLPSQYEMLRARLATGTISYKLDGFDGLYGPDGVIFSWKSGNDGNVAYAPRLTVTYSMTGDLAGPQVTALAASPNPTGTQSVIGLNGMVSDLMTGGSDVVAAEAYLDVDPGVGWGIPLVPKAGAFDSPQEDFRLWLDVSSLTPGTHQLAARGRDSAGNWGPVTTIALDVGGPAAVDFLPVTTITAELAGQDYRDVRLAWSPSLDSLGGPATIAGYAILQGETYDAACAGYAPLATVLADITEFVHYGGGDGNVRDFFYCIQVLGPDGSAATDGNVQAGKVTKALQGGMNLVSVPLVPMDDSAVAVFQTVDHRGIWTYDPSLGTWDSRVPTKVTNTLQRVDRSQGVWVSAVTDDLFTIAGIVPSSTDVALEAGWNLVGYPALSSAQVQDALAGIAYVRVEGFDPGAPPYNLRELTGTDAMVPKSGYWVYVDSAQTWTVANA